MSLIAVTGPIASGKSTAVKLLKHRDFSNFPFKVNFFDLDHFCKNYCQDVQLDFLKEKFGNGYYDKDFIIKNVIASDKLYAEYCQRFVPRILEALDAMASSQELWVVEASAYWSYPDIHHLFSAIIVVDAPTRFRTRNAKARNLDRSIFDIFDQRYHRNINAHVNAVVIQLSTGTLQELRGKMEEAFLYALNAIHPENAYLIECLDVLEYLNVNTSQEEWSYNPYHNQHHTRNVITHLAIDGKLDRVLGRAAIFHDFDYEPRFPDNEDRSASLAWKWMTATNAHPMFTVSEDEMHQVCEYVRDSGFQDVNASTDTRLHDLFRADIACFIGTVDEIMECTRLIFREYSFYDWPTFQAGNISILSQIQAMSILSPEYKHGIDIAISSMRSFQPKIGWFCGSFNPFTIGHEDVLKKAEQMFDKIVIVQARNPSKAAPTKLNELYALRSYEIIDDVKSIPELLNSRNYTPTLIRGIRNQQDVEDTQTWLAQINEFSEVRVECVMIPGSPGINHVSSSFVRHVESLGHDASRFKVH